MIFVISTIFEVLILQKYLDTISDFKNSNFFDIWIQPSNTKQLIMYLYMIRDMKK